MDAPLLSIVTPCLNRAALIPHAVESVLLQDYPHVEHVVADGGSTDGTLDVLRRYPHLRVASGKDRGLYDALNSAIGRAGGEVVGHINSDDLYEPRVFGAVMRAFAAHPEADAVVGGAVTFEDTPAGPAIRQRFAPPAARDFLRVATRGAIITNAWFFRRRVYERIGLFSLDYALAADRDFLLRFWQAGCVWVPLDLPVYRYRHHAGSLTINDLRSPAAVRLQDEYLRLARRLGRDAADRRVRAGARAWGRAAALDKVVLLARNGRLAAAAGAAAARTAEDPLWPVAAAGMLGARALAAVARRAGGRR